MDSSSAAVAAAASEADHSMMSGKKRDSSGNNKRGSNSQACPYLDTVNRSLLDFDFEPSCSVSMETGPHVYGCLVCGKFFRGRGKQTPAYTHSVDEGHFVYVHLTKGTFYCLPDDYVIDDPSLADISAAIHPTYTNDEIQTIDQNTGLSRDLFGRRYLPGYVGLNNLNKTDYINVAVQALAHVKPLRNFFLRLTHRDMYATPINSKAGVTTLANNKHKKNKKIKPPHRMSDLVLCFGELVRKIWSHQRFKSHVDPHMFVQAVSASSNKRFEVGKQAEIGEFMAWLLHQLHLGVGGSKTKPKSSIIQQTFQGQVEVTTLDPSRQDDDKSLEPKEDGGADADSNKRGAEKVTNTMFLQLTLDMAEKPLFRDDEGGLVIPQEPLVNVMKKFDGNFSDAISKSGAVQKKRYRLKELPPYLIVHLARFKTNNYSREKNPTIVAFPVKNLDLSKYTFPDDNKQPPTEEEIRGMSVKELRALLTKYGRDDVANNAVEKTELVEATIDFVSKQLADLLEDKYDLVANITHDSPPDVGREGKRDPLQEGSYKCHVQHRATNQWYQIQDLHVEPTMPQLIGVSESYLLIFERKSAQATR
mmetsp:Transcript_45798/g.111652  ORF Transcript_45798/g.111652 Transcript_45798/m.111652 type:complete len:589 (+) Transcript_45798:57-1823(+)